MAATPSCPDVSLVIPFLNEEEVIPSYVPSLLSTIERELGSLGWEVLLIDNASTDSTPLLLDRFSSPPRIRAIHTKGSTGLGVAVREGFLASAGVWLCYLPGDGQVPVGEILRLLREYVNTPFDLILPRRIRREVNWRRRVMSKTYNFMLRRAFSLPLHDAGGKPKLLRRSCLSRMPLRSDGWFIDAEIVIWSYLRGLKIIEIDVSELPRVAGHSKVRPVNVAHLLKEAFEFRLRARASS